MDWKAQMPALLFWLVLLFTSIKDATADEQRIVCYYTNWSVYRPGTAKFSPQNINPYLCTHLIYAFGGFTKENTLKPFDKYQDIEKGGYAKFTGLKSYNKNLKTMLAIGGWNEGSSRFSPMVADKQRRKEFVKNSVKFLRQNHFDGLDLDWEYPAFRDGGKPRDRDNYADLVQELREEFDRESSKTGRKRLLLTMAVPAGIEYMDKGYDIPRLNEYLDFINLLSYDYHSAFEPAVNHHAPLYPLEEDNEYNYDRELTIDYTIGHLLKSGASPDKIVLGIPTYGRSYTLINEDSSDIGAPADGPGEEGDATREKGYLAYYEICESIGKSDEWEVVQPNPSAMGPYAVRERQWVGYDDEDIVRAKARYVSEKKLGGIMFWSIDNDDFRGKCHGRPYPLIEAAKEALLAGTQRSNSGEKRRLSDNRKKGNTIGRRVVGGNRRTTTTQAPPTSRRRVTSSRANARTNARANTSNARPDDEEEEEDNVVKTVERPSTRIRSKTLSKNRSPGTGRRKQQHNSREADKDKEADSTNDQSLSNSFTTPEPPTTPDPGSDFKCEDEGFFPHPRDCKKYFWCLDSGPGGLGVVAHAFTCPSGLVFNKAADSCDYPRNVVCPKKNSQSTTTTTTEAATRSTTRKTTRGTTTTTSAPESEEYEYYDDEELEESQEEATSTTTTLKPLRYKTISRNKPTAATTLPATSTTTEAPTISLTADEVVESFEDEEDPRVLKELIDLIKKAGGIEQLEKQLHYQEKNSGAKGTEKNDKNENSTPAAISRSLYERVLSRQAARTFLGTLSTTRSKNATEPRQKVTKNTRSGFVNGPGGSQFEGLDEYPEVKSLRRTNKPKYTTIQRQRTSTSETSAENEDGNSDEEQDTEEESSVDNADVASTEDRAVSNPPSQKADTERRVTQSYVNIRRSRLPSTKSENDVQEKNEDSNAEDSKEDVTLPHKTVKPQQELNSRYKNIHRFRSTTSRSNEVDQMDEISDKNDITSESTMPTTTTTTTTTEVITPVTEEITETPLLLATTLQPSTTFEPLVTSTDKESSTSTESWTVSSSIDSTLKLVDESATEILLTTAAAVSSSTRSSPEPFTRGSSNAVVSQPRPFAFPRNRGRATTSTYGSTSSVASVTEQSRLKVNSESISLPTLKELVGYSIIPTNLTSTFAPSTVSFVNIPFNDKALHNEQVNRTDSKNQLNDFTTDNIINQDYIDTREVNLSIDKEILDNDVLGSVEIQQQRIFSSSGAAKTYRTRLTNGSINDTSQSINRVEVPVKILNDPEGESIAELILIRLPANKLDSAILKPVFTVKLVEPNDEQNRQNAAMRNRGESLVSDENSLENDLYPNRRGTTRRRRVRIKQTVQRISSEDDTPTKTSDNQTGEINRTRIRQRIVKARRKTQVKDIPLVDHSGDDSILKQPQENEQSVKIVEKITGKMDNGVKKLKNVTSISEISAEDKITTIRGNLPTSLKPSNITHGFYITRSSDEKSKTTTITEVPSIDSTGEIVDTAIQDYENLMSLTKRISTTTKEDSTDQSVGTTIGKMTIATTIPSRSDSSEIQSNATPEMFETVTSDYSAEIVRDKSTESSIAMIVTEPEEKGALEITTFRPFTIGTRKPADYSTTRYLTDSTNATTETNENYTVKNLHESTTPLQFKETSEKPGNRSFLPEFRNDQITKKEVAIHLEKEIDSTQLYDKAIVKPIDTTTESFDTTQNSVETTGTSYTLKSSPQRRTIVLNTPAYDDESDSTWINYDSTYDSTMKSTITSTETVSDLSTSSVEITDGNLKTLVTLANYDDGRKTTRSLETEDNAITSPSVSSTEQVYDNNLQTMTTSTVKVEETTQTSSVNFKRTDETTKFFESDSTTYTTSTPEELLTTTEAYGPILHNDSLVTAEYYQTTNFVGVSTSGPYDTSLGSVDNAATTEATENEITNSLESVTSTVKSVTIQKQVVDMIELTNNSGLTVDSAPTTTSWLYTKRHRNLTQNSDYDKSETVDILMDTTLPTRDSSPMKTVNIGPTTETVGTTGSKISEKKQTPSQAIDIQEEMSIPKSKISSTIAPAKMIDENTESTTTVSDDKHYSVSPVIPKRTRGRVRFTNSAASTDDIKKTSKPAKQLVVVRRRIAGPSSNHKKIISDPTEKNTTKNAEGLETIDEKIHVKKGVDEKLAVERSNSTKAGGRRVVVYRARPRTETTTATTMTTTTTVQSFSVTNNDTVENSGRVRRGKWKKRLVPKRSRRDDLNDQTIAETSDFHRAIIVDDSIYEEHLTKMIDQDLVGSVEQNNEDIATAYREGNIYKSFGGFPRRSGTLTRPGGLNLLRTRSGESLLSTSKAPFSKIQPIDSTDDTAIDDQSGKAQQVDVTLADPPEIRLTSTTAGRLQLRTATRKISTTMTPRREEEASTTWRTTPISRGHRQRGDKTNANSRVIENKHISMRPRRPAIIDYDYYVDDDQVRLVLKPELKDKLYVTRQGGIRCLDQGNFAHPTSCKKFITCARMVDGQVLGTEYTCPDKLSFDPVGGICNWSAGLGCEEKSGTTAGTS